MTPLLSICIPTYNRCGYLPETLESILAHAGSEIEIVISDNASTDATESVVADYASRHGNVYYSRADANHGPDANFLRVVGLARGTYCWLLSDDDTIRPGAIATILREIQSSHDIYTFSEITCDNRLIPIAETQRLAVPDGRLEYDFSMPSDLALFFERSDPVGGIPFGLISVLVFRKAMWDAVVIPEAIIGTAYVHVYVLLAGKDRGTRLKYVPQALVMNRLNESYISSDPIRSFWITADGYRLLADSLFATQQHAQVRRAFLGMARRILSLKHLALLRFCCEKIGDWNRIEARLAELGYSRALLAMARGSRTPLLALRVLVRAARSLISRRERLPD